MQESVTLIIKAANQSVPDEHIVCDADWSVLLLKNHLSSVHPAKPVSSSLIYLLLFINYYLCRVGLDSSP